MTEGKKGKCLCFLVLGIIFVILGLLADNIGLGTGLGFGNKQIAVTFLGVILVLLGAKSCQFGKCCEKSGEHK